jgi:hypothetical protein
MTRVQDARLACGLLAVVGLGHFGWWLAPLAAQADVWNVGTNATLAGLAAVGAYFGGRMVRLACVLAACFALSEAGCSLAWLVYPWEVEAGQPQCSALVGVPLGLVGLWLLTVCVAVAAGRLP